VWSNLAIGESVGGRGRRGINIVESNTSHDGLRTTLWSNLETESADSVIRLAVGGTSGGRRGEASFTLSLRT